MRLIDTKIPAGSLGNALQFFLAESERISAPGKPWPDAVKKLVVGAFVSGAQWGAGQADRELVLKQCDLAGKLFNKIPE